MKSYANEFKEEAVKLAKEVGAVRAAETLGISKNTLYTWISRDKKTIETGIMPENYEGNGSFVQMGDTIARKTDNT